ncbi:MAG: heme-binding protein [Flavobacteriia bacterium]|nr:heme-binding protein [Flavobacteriia bacterium]
MMAQKYETQSYDLVQTLDGGEIRFYPPVMKIITADENSFRQLFGFISGNNTANKKIAMTTPVYRATEDGKKTMAFVLPKKFTTKNTPQPNAQAVDVIESPSGYFLAYTYSGYSSSTKEKEALLVLQKIAAENKLNIIGAPKWLFYNSPYQFWRRKNELLLEIEAPK